jgi:hypothetical protein
MDARRCAPVGVFAVALAVFAAGAARAEAPGGPCYEFGVMTQDASGQTMWCDRDMHGDLAWQYYGPSGVVVGRSR